MSNTVKHLMIKVTDLSTGKSKANVKIPASLANFGMKMASKYAPEAMEGLNMDEILEALKNDSSDQKLVDVENEEKGERVEIFVE